MINTFFSKKHFIILALSFSIFILNAETFRVHKTFVVPIDHTSEATTVQIGINDSFAILLPEDKTYLQGISVEIKIPEMVATWRDSIAWSFFDNIQPKPTSSTIDYEGSSISSGVLPSRLSWNILIPLIKDNTLKSTPYAEKFSFIPDTTSGALFFRLQQAMKGTPDNFGENNFSIIIKPILTNKGKFQLKLTALDDTIQPCSLFIDEKPVEIDSNGIYLETGVHNFSLVSEFYRNEVRTIHIEQAKTSTLEINLRSIEPTVVLKSPANTSVFFDDLPIDEKVSEFQITQGEHIVRFVIGDYEIVKSFTAVKGQSYTVSLNIEAIISEDN